MAKTPTRVKARLQPRHANGEPAVTLEVDSLEAAERVIAADPFVREELLEASVVKPWVPD